MGLFVFIYYGGINIYAHNSKEILAKDRFVDDLTTIKENPDIIIGCLPLTHFIQKRIIKLLIFTHSVE